MDLNCILASAVPKSCREGLMLVALALNEASTPLYELFFELLKKD